MTASSTTNVPEALPFEFRITASGQGATSVIELEGEWDLAQRAATTNAIAQALDRGPACLLLDLSRLSFIDSSGIHVLINARNRCAEQGAHLVIIPGPRAVQRVFEICGLAETLPFTDHHPGSSATRLRHNGDGTSAALTGDP
jgi:anti-sigma B factor antagonist